MANILDRINEISDLEGISIGKIEQKIGASKGVLYKAIQKNTDIQSKWLVLIVDNFPQYSSRWLLTGKGEKLRSSYLNAEMVNEPSPDYGKEAKLIEALKNQITDKNEIIAGLKRENQLLWKLVDGDNNENGKKHIV